ncbi:vacuolar protein sorting 55 superfamily [Dissoconium aciculare CBS 342.82]|uniref:Vacuolar protein sorting 55 superfamily n=1 Tax=Dissoconium aciculare CBS 342.82 TaxID=1314786 RepID=A0A6J3MJZ1_9PEZI|nr:vacuolar protein sorting 55 superfamily [Dissoconium aciculare CBS 342.82]KAF1827267.1 vacuolar protein sorting 55 superfamily [Dissoconium aciculare CBS 342.82]
MAMQGLSTIIVLSFILAIGFLLVILSAALFEGNYLTLLVVATYVLAPVPNWICGKAQARDDFMDNNGSNSIVELGRFLTGFLVLMGIALPVVLAHCDQITTAAMAMSISGGLLIYGTIIAFGLFFREQEEF